MKLSFNHFNLLAVFASALLTPDGADAHGYLKSPRSRNYRAWEERGAGSSASNPAPEYEPQSLNIGGTAAVCGIAGSNNYDYPRNAIGGVLAPSTQACYAPGSIVEIESVLTAHHKGFFTVKACAVSPGQVPSQACFDSNPLTFVSDSLYGAVPDANYPERAYIPRFDFPGLQFDGNASSGGWNGGTPRYLHRFRLPAGLSGDLVLFQWQYITANSCIHPGYTSYQWPAGFLADGDLNLPVCQGLPPDGRGVPEQFWNCAEVRISSNCGGNIFSPPTSTPPPPSPTIISPTPPTASGTCGGGNRGNGVCANGDCCSRYGWCGTSSAHCDGNPPSPSVPTVPPPSPPSPPSSGGTCGGGSRGDGICANGQCCSRYGWCGTTSAHCDGNPPSPPSPSPPTSGGGTCGGGSRGDGMCANGECCSRYGWCGTSSAHCDGSSPPGPTAPQPAPVPQPSGGVTCSIYRCGVNWWDAYNKCGVNCAPWPNAGWDACPGGEQCFSDLKTDLACCA